MTDLTDMRTLAGSISAGSVTELTAKMVARIFVILWVD